MRLKRVLAIARRDLTSELQGRRGLGLLAVTLLLLGPLATVPPVNRGQTEDRAIEIQLVVRGDVPESVAAMPNVRVEDAPHAIDFVREPDGTLVVRGRTIPRVLRDELDGNEPAIRVRRIWSREGLPGRSLLLGLISVAVLTGAISESIGGERSRRTLEALLTASISRWELVVGKWLAWAAYGSGFSMLAATALVLNGVQPFGWWLLPLPTVAACTVALGLYVNRNVADVVTGATVSLRWLPAVLSGSAVTAWFLGQTEPLVGACVPIGGAMLASGQAWEGALPSIVATAVTGGATVALLAGTVRDIGSELDDEMDNDGRLWAAAWTSLVAATVSWTALVSPMLWGPAGNYAMTESLSPSKGVLAGGLGLGLVALSRALQADQPSESMGVRLPSSTDWWWLAIGTGLLLALGASTAAWFPTPEGALYAFARVRLAGSVEPMWAGALAGLTAIVGQELLFRGYLQHRVGPTLSTLCWIAVMQPLDPIRGVIVGSALALLTHRAGGSILPALVARCVWAIPGSIGLLSPLGATVASLVLLGGLGWRARDTPPSAG